MIKKSKGPTAESLAAKPSEHMQQVALFVWARSQQPFFPMLEFMYAIPNGGFRTVVEAGKFKAEGVKSGVPDVCLPYPNGGFHGMYIEMKKTNGVPSDVKKDQKRYIEFLKSQNYHVVIAFGYEQAKQHLLQYLTQQTS